MRRSLRRLVTALSVGVLASGGALALGSGPAAAETTPTISLTAPENGSTTPDSTPTFAGSTSTTAPITVVVRGPAPATTATMFSVIPSAGQYSIEPTTQFAEGTYTALAFQTEGCATGISSTITFTIDGPAPAVSLEFPADGSSLDDSTPTFGGQTSTNAPITISVTGPAPTTTTTTITTSPSPGTWSVSPTTPLAEGTYTAVASQTDPGGTGTSATITFTIDHPGPSIAITSPAHGSTVADSTPTFAGQASIDEDVTIVVTGSAPEPTTATLLVTPTGGSFSVDATTRLADGAYTAVASISDSEGDLGTSTITFTVDAGPIVTIDSPAHGSTTTDSTPTFTGSTVVNAEVGLFITGPAPATTTTRIDTTPVAGGYSTEPATPLADGTYAAVALQHSGNTVGRSDTITFTVDVPAPLVSIDSPADGSTTSDSTPTFEGQTTIDESVTVVVSGPSPSAATTTLFATPSGGAYSVVPNSALAEGTYTAVASMPGEGGIGTSSTITFTIDIPGPSVSLTSPTHLSTIGDSTPTFAGATSSPATVTVVVTGPSPATTTTSLTATPTAGGYSIAPTSPLADGSYTAVASQTNSACNTGTSSTISFTIDTPSPSISLTSPANGSATADTTPTFAGFTSSPATVTVVVTGPSPATTTTTLTATPSGGSYAVDPATPLANGTYSAVASQTDGGGTGMSSTVTFTISASGASAPRPGTPNAVTATPGPAAKQITVAWQAAVSNGSSITSYTATCVAAAANPGLPSRSISTGPVKRSVVIGGFVAGKRYACHATATNAFGTGPARAATPNVVTAKA